MTDANPEPTSKPNVAEEKARRLELRAQRIRNADAAKKAGGRIRELTRKITRAPRKADRIEIEQQLQILFRHAATYSIDADFNTRDDRTPADLACIEPRVENVVETNFLEPGEPGEPEDTA